MSSEVIIAICSLLGTAIGSVVGILQANRLVAYRIQQLEIKVDKHNSLVERMALVEASAKSAHKRLDGIKKEM